MTDQKEVILKAIVYEIIIAAGEEGTKSLLTANNLLADMAVPVTQYDFTYADRAKTKTPQNRCSPLLVNTDHQSAKREWSMGLGTSTRTDGCSRESVK